MADFSYTIGIDVDSSGIDSFIQKARGLANSVNFGATGGVPLPTGVRAAGPGIQGNNVNFQNPAQATAFAQQTGQAARAELDRARQAGVISANDLKAGLRQVDAVVNALMAGARKFEQVLGGIKGTPTQNDVAGANRQARVAIGRELDSYDKKEERNARRRAARAAEKAAENAEKQAKPDEAEAQARRDKTAAHRKEAAAAKKSAEEKEKQAARDAQEAARKRAEDRRSQDKTTQANDAAAKAAQDKAKADEAAARAAAKAAQDKAKAGASPKAPESPPPPPRPTDVPDPDRQYGRGGTPQERFELAARTRALQRRLQREQEAGQSKPGDADRIAEINNVIKSVGLDFKDLGLSAKEYKAALDQAADVVSAGLDLERLGATQAPDDLITKIEEVRQNAIRQAAAAPPGESRQKLTQRLGDEAYAALDKAYEDFDVSNGYSQRDADTDPRRVLDNYRNQNPDRFLIAARIEAERRRIEAAAKQALPDTEIDNGLFEMEDLVESVEQDFIAMGVSAEEFRKALRQAAGVLEREFRSTGEYPEVEDPRRFTEDAFGRDVQNLEPGSDPLLPTSAQVQAQEDKQRRLATEASNAANKALNEILDQEAGSGSGKGDSQYYRNLLNDRFATAARAATDARQIEEGIDWENPLDRDLVASLDNLETVVDLVEQNFVAMGKSAGEFREALRQAGARLEAERLPSGELPEIQNPAEFTQTAFEAAGGTYGLPRETPRSAQEVEYPGVIPPGSLISTARFGLDEGSQPIPEFNEVFYRRAEADDAQEALREATILRDSQLDVQGEISEEIAREYEAAKRQADLTERIAKQSEKRAQEAYERASKRNDAYLDEEDNRKARFLSYDISADEVVVEEARSRADQAQEAAEEAARIAERDLNKYLKAQQRFDRRFPPPPQDFLVEDEDAPNVPDTRPPAPPARRRGRGLEADRGREELRLDALDIQAQDSFQNADLYKQMADRAKEDLQALERSLIERKRQEMPPSARWEDETESDFDATMREAVRRIRDDSLLYERDTSLDAFIPERYVAEEKRKAAEDAITDLEGQKAYHAAELEAGREITEAMQKRLAALERAAVAAEQEADAAERLAVEATAAYKERQNRPIYGPPEPLSFNEFEFKPLPERTLAENARREAEKAAERARQLQDDNSPFYPSGGTETVASKAARDAERQRRIAEDAEARALRAEFDRPAIAPPSTASEALANATRAEQEFMERREAARVQSINTSALRYRRRDLLRSVGDEEPDWDRDRKLVDDIAVSEGIQKDLESIALAYQQAADDAREFARRIADDARAAGQIPTTLEAPRDDKTPRAAEAFAKAADLEEQAKNAQNVYEESADFTDFLRRHRDREIEKRAGAGLPPDPIREETLNRDIDLNQEIENEAAAIAQAAKDAAREARLFAQRLAENEAAAEREEIERRAAAEQVTEATEDQARAARRAAQQQRFATEAQAFPPRVPPSAGVEEPNVPDTRPPSVPDTRPANVPDTRPVEDVEAAKREERNARRRAARAAKRAAENAEKQALLDELEQTARRADQSSLFDGPRPGPGGGGGGGTPPPPPPPTPPDGGDGGDGGDDDNRALRNEVNGLRKKELAELQKQLAITRQQTGYDESIRRVKAEILVAEQQQARAERLQAQAVLEQARSEGFFNVGTRTQRIQAAIKSKDGQLADPLNEKTIGGLLAQRTIQASSFAVGGLAFYGALQILRDTIEESEALERQFAVVEGQIDRTFGSNASQAFDRFKERVRDISQATGALGSEVALVQRQLAAAFVPVQANKGETEEDFKARQDRGLELAGENAEQAFKFAEVTGLDSKEITDSLTAIGLSFDELQGDFTPILDRAVTLEEEFGVLGGQIITFTADLAPLGAQLGFSAQQLEELGAAAQKFSGRTGGQLAEQFGRIFTDLPTKSAELIALFSQTPELADLSSGLADAFVSNNIQQVLQFILQAASRVREQGLDPSVTQRISEVVAGRREGASFAAILREPQQLLEALKTTNEDSAGAVDERWLKVRESLGETMERLRRSVEQLAEALLSAGIADVLTAVADALGLVLTSAGAVVRVFDRLNDATGGIAGQAFVFLGALKSIDVMLKVLSTSKIIGLLAPGVAGRAAGALAVGGAGSIPGRLGAFLGMGGRGAAAAEQLVLPGMGAAAGGSGASLAFRAGRWVGGLGSAAAGAGAGAGGFFGNLAAGSRFIPPFPTALGSTVAGVAAPVTAAIALFELRRQNQELRKQISASSNELRNQAQAGSFTDLLRGFGTDSYEGEGGLFGISGTEGIRGAIGRTAQRFLGVDTDNDLRESAVLRGPEALAAGLNAVDVSKLTDAQKIRLEKMTGEIEKALNGEDADLEDVAGFMGELSQDYDGMGQAIGAAVDDFEAVEEASKQVGPAAASLDQLISALEARRTTPEAVQAALQTAIAPLQELADAALRAGDYTTYLANMEEIAKLRGATEKVLSEYAIGTKTFAEQLNGIFNQSTPETRIQLAKDILNDPKVTDKDTRLKALQDLQSARDEAFQKRLDNARNEGERLKILAQGPGTDPLVQAESIYQQFSRASETRLAELKEQQSKNAAFYASGQYGPTLYPDNSEDISSLENVTKEDIALVSEQLIDDIEEYGEGAIRIRLALLRARAAELRAAIAALGGTGQLLGADLSKDLAAIEDQIGIYEGLEASGLNPSEIVVDDGKLSEDQQREYEKAKRAYNRDYALAIINRQKASAAGDPVQLAALSQRAAQVSLDYARSEFGPDSIEAINAEAELISARIQVRSAAKEVALAQIDVARARANGDPVKEAALSIQAARVAAQFAQGPVEALQAQAQLIDAINAQQAAFDDIRTAQLELRAAQQSKDPLEAARTGLKQADLAIAQAKGTSAKIRAEAQRVQAIESLADVIRDIADAQVALVIAIAEAGGNSVEVARLRLKEAIRQLSIANAFGDDAAIDRARAEIVTAQRSYYDSVLQKQQSDIDFALQMEKISTQQAIRSYEQLLAIPTNTEEQNRELQLIIKRLRDEAGANLAFNISDIQLPTIYEVRRLMGSAETGSGGYQDNRQIQVTLQISENVDTAPVINELANMLDAPSITGIYPRNY